jgi:hypothetical protein
VPRGVYERSKPKTRKWTKEQRLAQSVRMKQLAEATANQMVDRNGSLAQAGTTLKLSSIVLGADTSTVSSALELANRIQQWFDLEWKGAKGEEL